MPVISRPNRAYTIALLVLGFILLGGVADMIFLRALPSTQPSSKALYLFIASLEALITLAIAATLALRAWAPAAGQVATVALNIVLLFMFPFGTVVGVFGLWKVDRRTPPVASDPAAAPN